MRLELLPTSSKINHAVFVVVEDYTYVLSNGFELLIPKGFQTDFASIPRFLHSFMSPLHTGLRDAAIIHDYLYDNWRTLKKELPECESRKWCDQEFRFHCRLNWRKWAMYFVLRVANKAREMYKD